MRVTTGNSGGTPSRQHLQPLRGGAGDGVRPASTRSTRNSGRSSSDDGDATDPLTDTRVCAATVVAAALTPPPRAVGVSWFAGERASRPERVEAYDLAALADDLRALVQLVRPKGTGAVLCPATFDDLGGDAPDLGAPRRLASLRCSFLVQLDVDGGATMREVVAMLGGWGVAAIVWPSPSAVGAGLDAERVRALVQIAPDAPRVEGRDRRVAPASIAGRRALVRLARRELGGARVDEGPAAAAALAFVHPRHAPRPPSDVVLLRGRAVDLGHLAAAAVVAGIVQPFNASPDRHNPSPYDLATLRDLAGAAGLAMHQGGRITAVECPRAHEHTGGGRGARGDTSCAIGPFRDPWRCEHAHGGDGRLGAAALVQLALQLVRDPARRAQLDEALHAAETPAARVREALGAAASAPADTITATTEDIPDVMREVGRYLRAEHARAGRAAVVLRAPPGSGKSRSVAALVDAAAPPPASDERDDGATPANPRAVAVILTGQRAHLADLAGAIFAPVTGRRRLPMVHTPVSRVLGADGAPVCVHERATGAASRIERSGGSARTVLCIDGRCPYTRECPAHDPFTPHDGERLRPDLRGVGLPRVVIATHAAEAAPRVGGLVVVDEAHAAPWEALEVNDREPESLTHAATLAGWQLNEGVARTTAQVCRALAMTPQVLRDLEPPARLAWCTDRAMELSPPALARVHEALQAPDAPDDPRARVAAALALWGAEAGAFALAHERRTNHRVLSWRDGTVRVADDAGHALRAVRAWLAGAPVVAMTSRRDDGPELHPEGSRITWEAAATRVAARWFADGGLVAHMDATGDAAVAAAIFGAPVRVMEVRLADRRDTAREVIADTRGTSRSQLSPRRGAVAPSVRWDRVGSQLGAVVARVQLWRDARGGAPVEGAGLARQIIARTLAAFWAMAPDAGDTGAAVDAACADLRAESTITRGDVGRELAALLADPRALVHVADLRAAAPAWRWTYPGHALARGSNDLRGCNVLVALGDFRATPAEAAAVAARTGRTPDDEAARLAGAVSVQWFGRARVPRDGAPVLLVHVGTLPPPDWRGVAGVEVVAAGARPPAPAGGAEGVAAAVPSKGLAPAADTPAARMLGALLAAGWTLADLARRVAGGRSAPSIARTLRRWRAGGEAQDAGLLAALADLARETRDPADALRSRVVYLTRGRGCARLWSGAGGAPGVRVFADRFGCDVSLADLAAFAGGASRPAVVDLLLREVLPGSPVVAVVEAAHGIAPPPPLGARSSAGERARVVAEGETSGSEWVRPDALRLRPGAARARRAPPPLAPAAVQLAPAVDRAAARRAPP
jgi:hypothetical protein